MLRRARPGRHSSRFTLASNACVWYACAPVTYSKNHAVVSPAPWPLFHCAPVCALVSQRLTLFLTPSANTQEEDLRPDLLSTSGIRTTTTTTSARKGAKAAPARPGLRGAAGAAAAGVGATAAAAAGAAMGAKGSKRQEQQEKEDNAWGDGEEDLPDWDDEEEMDGDGDDGRTVVVSATVEDILRRPRWVETRAAGGFALRRACQADTCCDGLYSVAGCLARSPWTVHAGRMCRIAQIHNQPATRRSGLWFYNFT